MKKVLIVDGSMAKSHVGSYTRSDGTFVKEHEDGRTAAAPKPAAKRGAKAQAFDHPNVVGHAADHKVLSGRDEVAGNGDLTDKASTSMKFGGKTYHQTGKTGKSAHDGTPVTAYEHEESGHRVWGDAKGRVHADSTSEVEDLRKQGAGAAPAKKPAAKKVVTRKEAAAAPEVKSNNTEHGFHNEAENEHLRQKHGPDEYHLKATQQDREEAKAHAARHFSHTANKLVEAGHFKSHDEARDYLDSRHGRHLHDGASFTGGDAMKVPWLAKDVARYKKTGGATF